MVQAGEKKNKGPPLFWSVCPFFAVFKGEDSRPSSHLPKILCTKNHESSLVSEEKIIKEEHLQMYLSL